MWVLVNRSLMEEKATTLQCLNRGLQVGDSVFTTIRAQDGKLLFWPQHVERLTKDAHTFGLTFNSQGLYEAIQHLLEHENLTQGLTRVRITLTRTSEYRGIRLTGTEEALEIISATPITPRNSNVHVIISNWKCNPNLTLSMTKHNGYQANQLALMEAVAQGFDDALLINHAGNIVSGTCANIFVRLKGETHWKTPRLQEGALPGIIRHYLLSQDNVHEGTITPHNIQNIEAAFLTNSVLGLNIIGKLNDQPLDINPANFPQINWPTAI